MEGVLMLALQIAASAVLSMKQACDGEISAYAMGTPPVVCRLFTGGVFWGRLDRAPMTGTYQKLLSSAMELSGLEHAEASAEWQASVIAAFVHPANHLTACSWFSPSSDSAPVNVEPVVALPAGPEQLFSLVLCIRSIPELGDFSPCFDHYIKAHMLPKVA